MPNLSRRQVLAAGAAVTRAGAQSRPERPNVMVIVLDDLGCRDLGYLGAEDLKTPNIDALARGGAIFRNWYSNAPVCAPARASILSGRFPARAGVPTNGQRLTPGIPNLGASFKAAGYRTAAVGKWHLGGDDQSCPNAHGFDSFYGFHSGCIDFYSHRYYWGEPRTVNYHDLWRNRTEIFEDGRYFTGRITEETLDFLDKARGAPFCAYVAYNAPHYPMHAPENYLRRFSGLAPERRTYAAMVAAVDDGVGAIRDALARSGRLENTLIFFAGDNGATTEKRAGLNQEYATAGSNGVFRGFKFSLFDGGTHIPGLIHWPARVRPRTLPQVVQSMDILPTALAAAGLALPEGLDGSSLLPVLAADAPSPHPALFWTNQGQLAVRQGAWKLVIGGKLFDRRPEGNQALAGEDALFLSNLDEDPGEMRNLRRLHPNLVDELATLARQWEAALPKPAP
jgi:arylsulfatase A-like enzyme